MLHPLAKYVNARGFLLGLAVLVLLAGLNTLVAHAAVVRGGDVYTLEENAVIEDDLYFLGNKMTLAGTTTGDVLVVGSAASSSGAIKGDVLAIAGRVTVEGRVHGDVRVAAGVVTISGEVYEDVVILGGNIVLADGAHVHGDMLVYGDNVELLGQVDGAVEVHVRVATLDGAVGHTATFFVRESLGVLDEAVVQGDLIYTAPRKAFISDAVQVKGETAFTPREDGTSQSAIDGMQIMFAICMYSFGAFALAWLFPRFTKSAVDTAFDDSGWLILKGFILLLAIPFLAILSCITILGVLPGVGVLFGYGALFALSFCLSGVLAGAILAQWFKRRGERLRPAWASLGGVALGVLTALPTLGFFVQALLVCLAFGTISMLLYRRIWQKRREA